MNFKKGDKVILKKKDRYATWSLSGKEIWHRFGRGKIHTIRYIHKDHEDPYIDTIFGDSESWATWLEEDFIPAALDYDKNTCKEDNKI